MKNKILEVMNQHMETRTLMEWAGYFDLQSPQDIKRLQEAFLELEKEYEVVLSKKEKYMLAREKGIYKGIIAITRSGSGYLDFEDRDSIYIPRKNLKGAMNKDLVVVETGISDNGKVIAIIERNTKILLGNIMGKRKPSKFIPDKDSVNIPVRIINDKEFDYPHMKKVQVKIVEYHERYLVAKIEKILGNRGNSKIEVLAVLLENGIIAEFPEEVLKEAQAIPQQVSIEDIQTRQDLSNQMIVTIDGADAKDLDDAVSIEKHEDFYRLGVHIADVSFYVKENSFLDKEAYERGTSTYVVDRVVPMLPVALSNGVCSLLPKVKRYTISCVMDIDKKGEVIHYQLFPSVIQSHAKMTYESVNKILRGNHKERQKYEHLLEFFEHMKELSDVLHKKREAGGAIDFEKDEAKIIVDDSGKAIDIQLRVRDKAERIIEDFMVCANEVVAKHMKWLEYPSIYRVHEKPSAEKIREFASLSALLGYPLKGKADDIHASSLQKILNSARGKESYPILSSRMLRTMQKARYSSECLGHFGLGLEEYSHFTSPIRRYPDLIVHRMLHKYVFPKENSLQEINEDMQKMIDCSKQSSLRERVAIEAERAVEDMKKAEYMGQRIGKTYEGIIGSILSSGFFVQLSNTVEGFVSLEQMDDDYYGVSENMLSVVGKRTKKEYRVGEKVIIKVVSANIYTRRIDFSLVAKKNKDNRKRR